MKHGRPELLRRTAGALIAVALIIAILVIADPRTVGDLLVSVDRRLMLVALAAAAASLVSRAVRLSLLLPPGKLGIIRAVPLTAAAQGAAVFIPARLGELVLPVLLRREIGRDGASGVATLLAARTLDIAALGAWTGTAVLFLWGLNRPLVLGAAMVLLTPLILLPAIVATVDRRIGARETARHGGRRLWAERLHRMRLGLDDARRYPHRLVGAAAASMVSWAFQWMLAGSLLAAMGHRWPVWEIVTGSAVASMSNLLPFNLIGNLGTLEAGWTAAFTAMGVDLEVAAATGLATHLWALIFVAVFGVLGWMTMALRRSTTRYDDPIEE